MCECMNNGSTVKRLKELRKTQWTDLFFQFYFLKFSFTLSFMETLSVCQGYFLNHMETFTFLVQYSSYIMFWDILDWSATNHRAHTDNKTFTLTITLLYNFVFSFPVWSTRRKAGGVSRQTPHRKGLTRDANPEPLNCKAEVPNLQHLAWKWTEKFVPTS